MVLMLQALNAVAGGGLNGCVMLFGSFARTRLAKSRPCIHAVAWHRIHSAILIRPEPEVLRETSLAPRHASPITPRPRAKHSPDTETARGRERGTCREMEGQEEREARRRGRAARLLGRFPTIKRSRIDALLPSSMSIKRILCIDRSAMTETRIRGFLVLAHVSSQITENHFYRHDVSEF